MVGGVGTSLRLASHAFPRVVQMPAGSLMTGTPSARASEASCKMCHGNGLTRSRIMSQAVKEDQIALAQLDTVNIEYKKLLVFFEDSTSVTLEARNNERDKEARRLRQELTHGWSIKRATD